MGCYVNPQNNMSKETFLNLFGSPTLAEDCAITDVAVPVCLVDNGMFTAAGVAYSEAVLNEFRAADGRFKQWFMVSREDLYVVSDLKHWE